MAPNTPPMAPRAARASDLTDTAIRQAKPGTHPKNGDTGGKAYALSDSGGLFLDVLPTGGIHQRLLPNA